jgi:REP element-mobilizing transposase RayT
MKRKIYSREINFITLTVIDWIDIFIRKDYKDFIIECLKYCQEHKGLIIYAYVIMTNHVHLIVKSKDEDLPAILRDFKSYSSKGLFEMILNNPVESRKRWMIRAFRKAGKRNSLNKNHQIWQNKNYPIAVFSNKVIRQKVDYIHNNPVKAGFVDDPSNYFYCSAHPSNPLVVNGIF